MRRPYHFPNERRRVERRRAPATGYVGPERRLAERRAGEVRLVRQREPINRAVLWAAVLMVLVVVDAVCLDGAYRRMVFGWVDQRAEAVRYWSAHLWGWER